MILPRVYNKQQIQDIKYQRLYKVGSRKFPVTISDINASTHQLYGFSSDSEIRKYLPLNHFRILNEGGTDLTVIIGNNDQVGGEFVPDSVTWTYDGDFYNFFIKNESTTSTATGSKIHVNVQRKPRGK